MDIDTFLSLPTEDVAALVRSHGPKVCVFPVNGTRRWLMLEHPSEVARDFVGSYLRLVGKRIIELFSLFFDHGVDTLLTPLLGPDLLERPDDYLKLVSVGLSWFVLDEGYARFYEEYDIRARVYGDSQRYLTGAKYEHLQQAFAKLAEDTKSHGSRRLFVGICAHDATETVAEIGISLAQQLGRPPTRAEIVEAYYGEYVEPVDVYVGFGRPAAYDMPLLATGSEDLYFTVAPSPYLDEVVLRRILYDHMFSRKIDDASYASRQSSEWEDMDAFYTANRRHVLGLGRRHPSNRVWFPLPEVVLPEQTADAPKKG
jgi:tuberculosinol/isotuberculosinol synthase